MKRVRIAVFIGPKGRGSNMRAIVDACRHGRLHADVAAVYCSNPDSPAIQNLEKPESVGGFAESASGFDLFGGISAAASQRSGPLVFGSDIEHSSGVAAEVRRQRDVRR